MILHRIALSLLPLPLLLTACQSTEDFVTIGSCSLDAPVTGATCLRVENSIGSVRVRPGATDTVQICAEVFVRKSKAREWSPAITARDLRIERQGDRILLTESHREMRDEWRYDYTITMPPSLALELQIGVGSVDVTGTGGSVEVLSGTGSIELHGHCGVVHAITGVGSIDAQMEGLAGGLLKTGTGSIDAVIQGGTLPQDLSLVTGVGSIGLSIPGQFAVTAVLSAGVGSVEVSGTDAIQRSGHLVGGTATGKLNGGGPNLLMQSASGSVSLEVRN